jgi:hypothetical protein
MGATSIFSVGNSKPIPTCSATFLRNATSSFNLLYTSATLLLDQPSQKRIRSSGACCFLSQVVRNRRNGWAPAFGWPNCLSNWCRESLKTFDCKRGSPLSSTRTESPKSDSDIPLEHCRDVRMQIDMFINLKSERLTESELKVLDSAGSNLLLCSVQKGTEGLLYARAGWIVGRSLKSPSDLRCEIGYAFNLECLVAASVAQ